MDFQICILNSLNDIQGQGLLGKMSRLRKQWCNGQSSGAMDKAVVYMGTTIDTKEAELCPRSEHAHCVMQVLIL